ncbi:hypothetical protein ACT009_07345 [Sphingomonas sp. Tas61C01]|uniref:hypothetical protein n=1 Tax=Sphingomonas sp. Tas61C01 TaxID=3458297 RepID=UPI00403E86BF
MIHPVLPATLLALALPAANVVDGAAFAPDSVRVTQMTIRQRIIIRVPRVAMPAPGQMRSTTSQMPVPIRWKEKKGPKCVAGAELAGAMIVRPRTVDVALTTGKRIRAILDDDCQPLDFYSGFYIRPGSDGMICADRDVIRVRSGATCAIDSFKTLVAAK